MQRNYLAEEYHQWLPNWNLWYLKPAITTSLIFCCLCDCESFLSVESVWWAVLWWAISGFSLDCDGLSFVPTSFSRWWVTSKWSFLLLRSAAYACSVCPLIARTDLSFKTKVERDAGGPVRDNLHQSGEIISAMLGLHLGWKLQYIYIYMQLSVK